MSTTEALDVAVATMAGRVETQLRLAIDAFERLDVGAAAQVVDADAAIDADHVGIEARVFAMLSERRLTSEEARSVFTAFKVAGELERVGDLAKNVAKRVKTLASEPRVSAAAGVAAMGRASQRQIGRVFDAYAARDLDAARAVWGGDQTIDDHYYALFQAILEAMAADSGQVSACVHLVFIAKNFERVGDHATNIAEALHFLVTGAPLAEARPKGDDTPSTSVSPRADGSDDRGSGR